MNINVNALGAGIAGFGIGIIIFVFVLVFSMLIMAVLSYIFESLAFYRFMENRNLENAFLAWIPIVRAYTVGKVYDDINEKDGKKTNFSIILLVLNCFTWLTPFLHIISINGVDVSRVSSGLAVLILELICFNLIFKKYTPDNPNYFILTVIFSVCPIIPFIPGLCLLKASKNQPAYEMKV